MTTDILEDIKRLQFSDQPAAEALALSFIREQLGLDVVALQLRPLVVSLNSFNGFMTLADGRRLFFKTHTEPDNVIGEYYHASALAQAGYPVLQPIYSSTEAGKQLLVYEVIEDPSVFDVAWQIENGDATHLDGLTAAQNASDDDLYRIYQRTLREQSAAEAANVPIHQLFYHRLVRGRLERFYGPLPGQSGEDVGFDMGGEVLLMSDVRRVRWEINGQRYDETLDDIITRAVRLLEPEQPGPSISGHGDAHNGNVFYRQHETPPTLLYFDPAFAGQHHPLLDLTKPLFHNVFAMWMYYPQEKAAQTSVQLERDGDLWRITHDYALPPVRHMFLNSKVERVLRPTLAELSGRGWLRPDWRAYLKASLFCCPFLTMNLSERAKFPPSIGLLGLAMAVEMGSESAGTRSLIDRVLDSVSP
jgi:hypothetical protein